VTPDPAAPGHAPDAQAAGAAAPAPGGDGVSRLATLWTIVFVSMLGFGITIVPFPVVAEQFGASPFWITWGGTGSFALAQVIATPALGRLSDRIGRKPVLVLGSLVAIVAYLWAAVADDFASLLAARGLAGFASGYLSAAFAYVADISPPQTLARRMGLLGSAFGLGFAAGPLLGGVLGQSADGSATLYGPCLFAAGLSLIGLLGTLFAIRESIVVRKRGEPAAAREAPEPIPPAARTALLGAAAAMLAISSGTAALQSLYPIWGRDVFQLELGAVGVHFAVFSACTALSQLVFVGPLVRRLGERRVMLVALCCSATGLALYASAQQVAFVWIADLLCGTSIGLFGPAASSVVSTLAPASRRGAILGLFNATSAAGRVVGPAYAGAAYALSRPAPFVLAAVLIALTSALVLVRRGRS
jgi:MFS family permease